MAVYPATLPNPSLGSSESLIIPIKKTEKEGNYIQVRRTATRSRSKFELDYEFLTFAEKTTLTTFFDTNQGTAFSWTHPLTSVTYNVVFGMEELKFKNHSTYCTTTVLLEEL